MPLTILFLKGACKICAQLVCSTCCAGKMRQSCASVDSEEQKEKTQKKKCPTLPEAGIKLMPLNYSPACSPSNHELLLTCALSFL